MDDADRANEIEQSRVLKSLTQIKQEINHMPTDIFCEDCEKEIGAERRRVMPSCTRCVTCQDIYERPRRVKRF